MQRWRSLWKVEDATLACYGKLKMQRWRSLWKVEDATLAVAMES
jgi:hypothetical protein